jgi:hypothetical protein
MDDESGHIIDRSIPVVNTNSPYSEVAQEILRSISILQRQGEVRELALADPQVKKHKLWGGIFAGGKAPMICGWYRDLQKMARDAADADAQAKPVSIYVTLNPASDALLGRANERLKASADRTQDLDITRRDWFYIDLDPNRPKGISSTDTEKQAAWDLACAARDYFIEQGWPDPVLGDSGNGYHLVFKIDLPNDEASRDLIKSCLQAAAHLFNTDQISVDTSVFNAARLIKLWGTMARKGDDTTDRPHRRSCLLHVPDKIETVTVDQLQWLAAQAPDTTPQRKEAPQPNQRQNDNSGQVALEAYLSYYGIEYLAPKQIKGGTMYPLKECLFDPSHGPNEAAIIQWDNGKITYQCFHNSCQGRTWHEARRLISGDDSLAPFMPGRAGTNVPQKSETPVNPEPKQAQASIWDKPLEVSSLINIEPSPLRWFATDNIPLGRGIIVTGIGGSSKTRLIYQLAIGAACGAVPWDWQIEARGKSVLVLTEDTQEDVHRTLYYTCKSFELSQAELAAVYNSVLIYPLAGFDVRLLTTTKDNTLAKTDLFFDLEEKIKALGEVVFIGLDPALSLTTGDEMDQGHQRALGKMADDLAVNTGATVALVSHATKASLNQDELTSHASRGGGAITDAVRAEFAMRTMTATEATQAGIEDIEERKRHVQLVGTKGNLLPPAAYVPVWLRRDQHGTLIGADISLERKAQGPSHNDMKVHDVLTEMSKKRTPTLKEWREECVQQGLITGKTDGAIQQAMKRSLERLKKSELIRPGHGRGIWIPNNG